MFSRFFVERPIFAVVVALLIIISGAVSLSQLPVQQYPSITPVQVTVQATYPGADSKTLADSVAAPIEAQINGVDNMLYMSSTSSATGQLLLTVYFALDTDPDIAQVQVQNRVNLALPQLPSAVTQQGVSVQKKSATIMMLVAITGQGDRYSAAYVANYANVYVLDALKRVPGAGQAQIMGVPDQAMRIWMNPDRMASLGVTTSDLANAVNSQNALFGAGQIGQQPDAGDVQLSFPVVTQSQFTDPRQYERIILRADQNGSAIVRLGAVARAEVGLRQYIVESRLNNAPATLIAIYQQPGANGLLVSKAVRNALEQMKARFPDGLDYAIALDTNDFVRLSIEEVLKTLAEALLLVVLVVYLFLQSLRTTLICSVAIVVSLIATFTGMLALGFSINLLTLFGLILAIGMVVDDAIVVVENVERNMAQHHLSPRDATLRSMGEIGSSLVAVVLVMASVFVPAAFLPGTTGQLYKQFAITIVLSVAVSGFIALTLTPAMCALLLKHTPPPQSGFFAWFNRQVERVTRGFGHAVEFVIKRTLIALALLGVFLWAIWHLFQLLPTSFVPQEDQGYAMVAIIMPQSASLDRTQAVAERVDALLAKTPGVDKRSMITGYSLIDGGFKNNAATFFVTFKDFKQRYATIADAREQNARAIIFSFFNKAKYIEEAIVLPIAPPPIPGIGTTGGFEFWIQDTAAGSPLALETQTRAFLQTAQARPELSNLHSTFTASAQQLRADVDREKSTLLGVPVQDVYSAIQAQFGSLTASQFSQFSRVWWVIVQSDAPFRQQPSDLTRLYTRSNQGKMVPLSAVVETRWTSGPDILPHFNGFPAAKIIGNAAPGYSSGQAIAAMEEVATQLPPNYAVAWSGLAFDEKQSGGTSKLAFAFGFLIVFLVLAAQYESWSLPGAVMTAIPFGVLGALLANAIRGLENDVYFQIGLLVLIGLGAKNAVLRVSAAVDFRKQGKSIMEATVLAGEQRLRPIIMTSLAFAVGCLPLALAVGAGANARHSIGTGIIGGMIGETTLAMLYVPLFFFLFDRFAERRKGGAATVDDGAPAAEES
ncbi:MAG: multidrug efflux RND transporter permease subunit [Candidatus Accumulibacter sp.]|uniref:efflux RND transporter permease subunit n=1 Tax=Accumulibacter sp. TaxID=2053492 RepID=UPI0025D9C90C|nr:multidrug efflux RND transporter permease subunit [Accumulibacter sp.]MCP5247374.1 multidrug efflux RND transporter permease subunit [Accumulibacter sp.]